MGPLPGLDLTQERVAVGSEEPQTWGVREGRREGMPSCAQQVTLSLRRGQ